MIEVIHQLVGLWIIIVSRLLVLWDKLVVFLDIEHLRSSGRYIYRWTPSKSNTVT